MDTLEQRISVVGTLTVRGTAEKIPITGSVTMDGLIQGIVEINGTLVLETTPPRSVFVSGSILVEDIKPEIAEQDKKAPDKDVHTEHCCKTCGCKYGEDKERFNDEDKSYVECSVVSGRKPQSHPHGKTCMCYEHWYEENNNEISGF